MEAVAIDVITTPRLLTVDEELLELDVDRHFGGRFSRPNEAVLHSDAVDDAHSEPGVNSDGDRVCSSKRL